MGIFKRNKRKISALAFGLYFVVSGLFIATLNAKLTGTLFIITSICALAYLPILNMRKKKKGIHSIELWMRKEIQYILVFIAILHFIGLFESMALDSELITPFATLLFLIAIFSIIKYYIKKKDIKTIFGIGISKFAFWVTGISMIIFVITFISIATDSKDSKNDLVLLDNQGVFLEILVFIFFITLLILVDIWLIRQVKSLIRLKNEKAKTELLHLKSQVNPHFFFNMLNNLYGLVEKDSKKAQDLILKLSDMMRYSIYDGQKELVTIEEEIEYLKNYIELHKMRYHKSIDVTFNLHIQEEGYRVMPLLFIILLENAFKHGVENLREGAFVNINLIVGGGDLNFAIENNFDKTQTIEQHGIGLKNLKRRLELVYPKTHSLSFTKIEDIYKAQLTLKKL